MSRTAPSAGRSPEPTASSTAAVERFWDEMARRYERGHESRGYAGRVGRARAATVRRLVGEGPGELLDAGMGPGLLLAEFAARGWSVSGIDLSEEMLALARARLPDAADRLRKGEIERLPFDDLSFDVVVATGVLEYVAYRPGALEELARVLRPGGRAVLSVPNRRALRGRVRRGVVMPLVRSAKRVVAFGRPARPPATPPPTRERFERALAAAGLSVTSVSYVGAGRRGAAGALRGGQIVFAARRER